MSSGSCRPSKSLRCSPSSTSSKEDFVVDHTPYATLLGDHATPLDEALAATLK
jgi:hypothetical protein